LSTQYIQDGGSATPPIVPPNTEDLVMYGWSLDGTDITMDTDIYAMYHCSIEETFVDILVSEPELTLQLFLSYASSVSGSPIVVNYGFGDDMTLPNTSSQTITFPNSGTYRVKLWVPIQVGNNKSRINLGFSSSWLVHRNLLRVNIGRDTFFSSISILNHFFTLYPSRN
jgi:hypothetical protein